MSSIKASRLLCGLSAAAAALALAACGTTGAGKPEQARLPTDQFPIAAAATPVGIQLTSHKDGLSDAQTDHLRALVADWRVNGSGMIVIEIPACACDDAADAGYATRDYIRSLGVEDTAIRLLGYNTDPGGPIRVSFQRVAAKTYDCGKSWSDLTKTGDNNVSPNFGCARNSNLAAMIDNPSTIQHPTAIDPANPDRTELVIERYRAGQATGSQKDQDSDVKISNVAK